ncbi:hypothetical protein GCM10009530_40510 [Microbispora corallina]|uniref:AB hydrolase-1 domain-containing protein n=1 Tax=Microbispora corallina TaxID=83302 RepID=A0ABQ4GB65_9ACTN|nr:alpha/beta fold hydrolase [Microbispora corallina]GIH44336.1 hypothetical protein Mco01_73360 [Microbispora corallina]
MHQDTEPESPDATIFVLVHGGAHGAWAFGRLASLLVQEGHQVVAQDLPGHGLGAGFPRSYTTRPLNLQEFATEPSPIAHLSLRDYSEQVIGCFGGSLHGCPTAGSSSSGTAWPGSC